MQNQWHYWEEWEYWVPKPIRVNVEIAWDTVISPKPKKYPSHIWGELNKVFPKITWGKETYNLVFDYSYTYTISEDEIGTRIFGLYERIYNS